jgi:NAD(P)-dependent dehydrogenase (short-subunit alcohol dehydrogenase family)
MPSSVAIVTGAARGIGRAIATTLHGAGWTVAAASRSAAPDTGDPRMHHLVCDVTDPQACRAAVGEVLAAHGRLDAVVANAGIAHAGAFEDTPDADIQATIRTNFFGLLHTARAALPALRASRGRLLITSSDNGRYGTPGLSAYTASKYAVEGWAESVRDELAPFGVRVVLLQPGAYRSDIWAGEVHERPDGPYGDFGRRAKAAAAKAADAARDPEEVGRAALKALTDEEPRFRVPVGTDARIMTLAAQWLPHRLRAAIIRRELGLGSWRPRTAADADQA